MNAIRSYWSPGLVRAEVINARVWAGVHYRFSAIAGAGLGRRVALYDLQVGFRRLN